MAQEATCNAGDMQETQVQFLGWEDPLESEMATYSSILAWEIPWAEEPGGLQSRGRKELVMTEQHNNNNSSMLLNSVITFFPFPTIQDLNICH